ncbi:MAG: alpha/beta fold hydrolase [Anaerolineae bacterium]|nr:alpha/beta fold hydrolase [Anaerolineae bacterium]
MDQVRWTDYIALALVLLTFLVGAWYVAIWFLPAAPINPFPPQAIAVPVVATPSARAAPVQDVGARQAAYPATWTPAPTALPTATATRVPTWTPWPTSTPTPKPTLDPRWSYTIAGMRARTYAGSEVVLYGTFGVSPQYTTYLIFYASEGLRISGMMNVPKGAGPFPVVILCHGYIHPDKYATGNDTWREADYLANHGYLTIAPDYRSHAASDNGVSFYHIGYAQDILNLISSLGSVDKADSTRIGLWGHSMGGAIALKAAVVSKKVDAVAVFGSVHADERINYASGMGNGSGEYGVARLGAPQTNPLIYKRISPINYLDRIPALSIHHGTADQIVPYQWSQDLYEAALQDGVEVELHLYPGGAHTFQDADWDLALERTTAFFDKHVK